MRTVNPMFHMDVDYNWRWYLTGDRGKVLCISARSFFNFEDARRDYDVTQGQFMAKAA
uniref:hypothetical protein n=1 Tax=Sphingomonas populi TaxID=2484750 RepID=UPI0013EEE53E|nr:hypothetical protein [Sphingomonas populi]